MASEACDMINYMHNNYAKVCTSIENNINIRKYNLHKWIKNSQKEEKYISTEQSPF